MTKTDIYCIKSDGKEVSLWHVAKTVVVAKIVVVTKIVVVVETTHGNGFYGRSLSFLSCANWIFSNKRLKETTGACLEPADTLVRKEGILRMRGTLPLFAVDLAS